jgi:putative ABC transport system permease protein
MIRVQDLLATAMGSLRANPLRSALTALGVIIGVGSVIAMVALGQGAQARVSASISSLGSNLIVVVPGATRGAGGFSFAAGGANTLTFDDAMAIAAEVPGIVAVAPSQRSAGQIVADGANWNSRIEGVTPDYLTVRDWEVAEGRFFDEREERQARRVVVLGATVADNLFPNADPVGARVRINGGTFEVIGVLEGKGQSGMGQDQDDIVLAPYTTVKRRIAGRFGRPGTVSSISIKAESEAAIPMVQEEVSNLLRQRHRIAPGADDDFTVQNLTTILNAAGEATRTFTLLLLGISAVSLLVGGIGIMNIMLVSVTERTREIGLRKALGARRGDILSQFALEAIALSLAGGLIGILLGVLGAWGITSLADLPLVIEPSMIAIAIGFSIAVGVVFGAYPAWSASRLDPIVALRRE